MASAAYIIQEYEILKKIFLNLNTKDLLVAGQVCRDWERISRRIISSRAAVRWHTTSDKQWSHEHDIPLDTNIIPKVILYISKNRFTRKKQLQYLLSRLASAYELRMCNILALFSTQFIAVNPQPQSVLNDESMSELLLLLPEFEGLKLSVHLVKDTSHESEIKECVAAIWSATSSIILASSDMDSLNIVDAVMAKFSKRDRLKLIGGIASSVVLLDNCCSTGISLRHGICVLCINLPAYQSDGAQYLHSCILDESKNMSDFFKQMAETVGPVKVGWNRLALAVSCVNRLFAHDDLELQLFSKFLPNVPLLGFWSLGEFYFEGPVASKRQYQEVVGTKNKRAMQIRRDDYFHQESTCYLIVTFKK